MRFRRSGGTENVLYQIGQGMFSAHAIPPYRDWTDFAPLVSKGLEAALAARPDTEKSSSILPLSLHYINAFRGSLTQGKEITEFLSEIFKIRLALPEGITKHIASGYSYKPSIVLNFPVDQGTLNISIGEAIVGVNPEPALLLDLLFSTTRDIQPESAKLLDAFSRAHVLLHSVFTELTKPIEPMMNPVIN